MKFEDIERLVGQETIANLQGTVASVLETSGGDHDTVRALRKFLVGLLAAIATTKTYFSQSEQFAAEDAVQLNALVRKIKEIAPHQAAKPMPAHVMEPARHAARAVAAEMRTHNVVPFPVSARVPREPEPEPLAGRVHVPSGDRVCCGEEGNRAEAGIERAKAGGPGSVAGPARTLPKLEGIPGSCPIRAAFLIGFRWSASCAACLQVFAPRLRQRTS